MVHHPSHGFAIIDSCLGHILSPLHPLSPSLTTPFPTRHTFLLHICPTSILTLILFSPPYIVIHVHRGEIFVFDFIPFIFYQINTTQLYMASQEGHHNAVQSLLEAGADVNMARSKVSDVMFNNFLMHGHRKL